MYNSVLTEVIITNR